MKCCKTTELPARTQTLTLVLDSAADSVVYSYQPEIRLEDGFDVEPAESIDLCLSLSRMLRLI